MNMMPINPFFVGNAFMNYCIKEGWIILECGNDKKLHYFLTKAGEAELKNRFGIVFGSSCSKDCTND